MKDKPLDSILDTAAHHAANNPNLIESSLIVFTGIQDAIESSINTSKAAGSTDPQMAPFSDLQAAINNHKSKLADSIVAHTSAAGTPAAQET